MFSCRDAVKFVKVPFVWVPSQKILDDDVQPAVKRAVTPASTAQRLKRAKCHRVHFGFDCELGLLACWLRATESPKYAGTITATLCPSPHIDCDVTIFLLTHTDL